MRKTKLLFTLLLLLLTLTGCVRTGVGVIINEDCTGTVELSFGINANYYNSMTAETGEEMFAGRDTAILTDGDDEYICVVDHFNFKTLDELESILLGLKYNDEMTDEATEAPEVNYSIFSAAEVEKSGTFIADTYTVKLTTNFQTPEETTEGAEMDITSLMPDDMFKLQIAITMPGSVKSESGTIDGNTATFTVTDITKEHTISAESTVVNYVSIVTFIAAALILTIVIIFLCRKKSPQTNNEFN